ncbi:MAG: hypothetical protein LBI06_00695, partial [Treponema sp.]|jgi:hypothetical protein|nr:hypothetical protein [Treponema sp.]
LFIAHFSLFICTCEQPGGTPIDVRRPSITTQPAATSWDVSVSASINLTVSASKSDSGTLSYQWYSNTGSSNSGGTAIQGKTDSTLVLDKKDYANDGERYFYAIVTNTISDNGDGGTKTASAASNVATVIIIGNQSITLYTAEDMAKIGVEDTHPLSGIYLLMNDITLANWLPIGGDAPFSGKFDGNNKTIALHSFADPVGNSSAIALPNLILTQTGSTLTQPNYDKVFLGIFASVKGDSVSAMAEIKNLSIHSSVNVIVNENYGTAAGLVAGYAELAVIDNVALSGTFEFKSESGKTAYVGGVAGIIVGDAEPGGQAAGTTAGMVVKNSNSSLIMDIKPGSGAPLVQGLPNPFSWAGGIVGFFMNGAGIENCHSSGDVSGISEVVGSQVMVGGIAGGSHYAFSMAYQGYIQDCSSAGDIKVGCMHFWPFAGGIAGTVCGGQGTRESSTRIERCYATGTVSIVNIREPNYASQWPYIGGIVGYVYSGAWVSQCYFNGTVIVDRRNDYTGGIAGYSSFATGGSAELVCVIEDCWSDGEVTGYNNAGGIVGQNQQNTILRRSYSRAAVSITNGGTSAAAQWGIGGIAGSHSSSNPVDAMLACVALNSSITAAQTTESSGVAEIRRIAGRMQNAGTAAAPVWPVIADVYALADLIPETGSGNYVADKGPSKPDGADIPADYMSGGKPTQAFYESIGWDFTHVWEMGVSGCPILQWQKDQ